MKILLVVITIFFVSGCTDQSHVTSSEPSITDLADAYFFRVIEAHPEYAYYADVPLETHAEFSSNSLSSIKLWETFEDSLFTEIKKIDEAHLISRKDKITYWFLYEDLESSIEMRVCHRHLWNVDPESSWLGIWLAVAQVQPLGTEELRNQALARWNLLPQAIETEIENLKLGMSLGYTMPKVIVSKVMDQMTTLLECDIDNSPFMVPALRDDDQDFYLQWQTLVSQKILPAVEDYHAFLRDEYYSSARENVSILDLPHGEQCYQAYIRKFTSTNKTGTEIYELGQEIVARNKAEIEILGQELYGIDNFSEIISQINNNPSNFFKTGQEILETNERLMAKAKNECSHWFSTLPASDVTIKPYQPHETGSGAYEQASGPKPAYYRINLSHPEKQQKGSNEVLTFHEAYPGHHVQIALEKEIKDLHPIVKLMSFTSYVEGWARYCEQLAEEMELYESKSALISRRAWPSRGMVVDPGIHLMGWTRQQAVDYMTESGMNEDVAQNLYFRSIATPAQLTSYDVGGEEIKALRRLAEEELGSKFDIKIFHEKILSNGAVPLNPLRVIMLEWIDSEEKSF